MTAEELAADHFISWARNHAVPVDLDSSTDGPQGFRQIGGMIGKARVVGFGESQHYVGEFNWFRSRLFRYLVTEMGFTTFVFECDVVEAKCAYDYVLGLHDREEDAFLQLGSIFGLWREIQDLLHWMRDYNKGRAVNEKIHFYGMDGSQSWSCPGNSVTFVYEYLRRVDRDYAEILGKELVPLANSVKFESLSMTTSEDVQKLMLGITSLITNFHVEEIYYIDRSSWEEFDWAYRAATIAWQITAMLRAIQASPDNARRIWWNNRDACMATNLRWIIEREGAKARLLVGAHNIHLQNAFGGETDFEQMSMGQILSSCYPRNEFIMIAGTNNYSLKPNDPAIAGSLQWALGQLNLRSFILDLRKAEGEERVIEWLKTERCDRTNTMYQSIKPSQAWDAIFFTQSVSLDDVNLPAVLQRPWKEVSKKRLKGLVGTYDVEGMIGQPVVLRVLMRDGCLISSGIESDGELFPMHESKLFAVSDTEFHWPDWPMVLKFKCASSGIAEGISICSPCGRANYDGVRRAECTGK